MEWKSLHLIWNCRLRWTTVLWDSSFNNFLKSHFYEYNHLNLNTSRTLNGTDFLRLRLFKMLIRLQFHRILLIQPSKMVISSDFLSRRNAESRLRNYLAVIIDSVNHAAQTVEFCAARSHFKIMVSSKKFSHVQKGVLNRFIG